jgi:hypothetical protein
MCVMNFMKLHEINLTRVLCTVVHMATKINIKCKALSVSEKLEIIKKADAQPYVMYTKAAEQLSITVSTLNNIVTC